MNAKTAATVIGGVYLLQAVGIFFGAADITSMAFENSAGNEDALWVGTLMHQALAGITFGIGCIMMSVRNMQGGAAPIFRGFAIGSLGIIGVACYHWATQPVQPPIGLLVIMVSLAIYGWLAAGKAA
ncbi:MAG: hypothetical protein L7S67_08235 [Flavobacteriales bacterium]|nr:hypothetical protein [Flavobacteriales bacterium]